MNKLLAAFLFMAAVAHAADPDMYEKSSVPPKSEFYVTAYGARCKGATDGSDTAGIGRAVTAAGVSGGTVIFTGNCSINNTTTVPSNVALTGKGGAKITPVTRASWAGTANNQAFVLAANATNITIQGLNFAYDSSYTSGGCHIIDIVSTNSKVLIKDNTSTYCGDFSANIGATDVTITNNQAYSVNNACYDTWSGATHTVITNNICTVLASGTRGIEFTGLTTALTAATSSNVVISGNIIRLLGSAQQGINVDGLTSSCAGNAAETYGTIADNHIFMAAGQAGNGILLRFCANYWDVHDNQIVSDGTDNAKPAIAVNSDSNYVLVHHNLVYNWSNQVSGAERGLFRNASVGGTLSFNECFGCSTATALVGATDTTTLQFANDTGSGALTGTFGSLTIAPGTSLSQATWGTAGIALIGSAFTANDTTTGSGGVNAEVAYGFGAPTFTNTQGTANVLTTAATVRIPPPICGSGWASCTNLDSLIATGRVALNLGADIGGASINVNANNNFATNINTGTSNGAVGIGGGSSAVTLNSTTSGSVTTGAGSFTTLGSTSLHTASGGITASGAATSINDSSNFATTIGTGTTSSNVSLGGTANAVNIGAPLNLTTAGNLSAATWTTSGLVLSGTARTLTDTSATTGTTAIEAAGAFPIYTFNSTNASVVVTDLAELYLPVPAVTGNVTATNLRSLYAAGGIKMASGNLSVSSTTTTLNGSVNINASNNAATSIGTGSTNANVSIGNGANLTVLGPTEINTGTKFTLGNFSGCSGTNGTPTTLAGGPQGGSFVTASSGTTCSVVITINGATGKTAANGWACWGSDITTAVALAQSASSTTTCTLKGTINAIGDTVIFMAMGY